VTVRVTVTVAKVDKQGFKNSSDTASPFLHLSDNTNETSKTKTCW